MQKIQNIISTSIKDLYSIDFSPDISPAPKPELGEYCVNIFPIVKQVGKAPNIISEEVASELSKKNETFKSTSATGGYVNFFLTDAVWMELLKNFEKSSLIKGDVTQGQGDLVPNQSNKNPPNSLSQGGTGQKTIVVDYIGMNVGKPPHIGHICTPLQGQAIINTLKYVGYNVISDSHLGDWGSLFGKLIVGYKKYGNEEKLHKDAINHLLEIYVAINTDAEKNPQIEQACRDAFRELSNGNPVFTELWAKFTEASITTNKKMLELMHIYQDFDIGESFYEGINLPRIGKQPQLQYDMNSIVEELLEKGIASKNEDESVGVVFPEGTKMPSTILRKKDGTNLYLTSDLAAIKYRLTNGWNPIKILYFVDIRQQLHLKQAFWIAKEAWGKEYHATEIEFFHAANGAMVLPEGAMSTRKGNIIRLDSLVEEGFNRVKKVLEEKGRDLKEDDIREIAIGAIKYSYLSQDRERDVIFTWDKALNFEGNSGPYIQYAYVRAKKITSGLMTRDSGLDGSANFELRISSYDKSLIQALTRFEEVVNTVAKTYKPHHLALYAYDLAVAFNSFYVHTPKILEEPDKCLRDFRLSLVNSASSTLEKSFELLGIKMPSEM